MTESELHIEASGENVRPVPPRSLPPMRMTIFDGMPTHTLDQLPRAYSLLVAAERRRRMHS